MFESLCRWSRVHTRKAVALALIPALVLLAADAWLEHFVAHDGHEPLQWIPVNFGLGASVLLALGALAPARQAFTKMARFVGGVGVLVGLSGVLFHVLPLLEQMKGVYDWPTFAGAMQQSPPLLAPLAFAGVGAICYLLASPRLSLRIRRGRPARRQPPLRQGPPVASAPGERKAG
jgi:hypothetical protein